MITFGVIQLLFFFFPGLICYMTFSHFTRDPRKEREDYKSIIFYSLLCGVLIYLITYTVHKQNAFVTNIMKGKNNIEINEFFLSLCVGFILSLCLINNKNHRYVEKHFDKITKNIKATYSTIFIQLMSTEDDDLKNFKNEYVRIVYKNSKLRYIGFITHYTPDVNNNVELFLESVSVYENDEPTPTYEVKNLYINDSLNNFFIEYLNNQEEPNV